MTSPAVSPETLECSHCRGRLAPGNHAYHVDRSGYHLILDAVPALVCQQCGEPFFDRAAVGKIQEMIRTLDEGSLSISAL